MMSYEACLSAVCRFEKVHPMETAKLIREDWRAVSQHFVRAQREGLLGRMDHAGWRAVLMQPVARETPPPRWQEEPPPYRKAEPPPPPPRPATPRPATPRSDTPGPQARDDERFEELRRLIARELHPDTGGSELSTAERALKQRLFQRIWPKLQAMRTDQAA